MLITVLNVLERLGNCEARHRKMGIRIAASSATDAIVKIASVS